MQGSGETHCCQWWRGRSPGAGSPPGFEVGELPVLAGGMEADRILLARIDPRRFRFAVRSAPSGNRTLDDWLAEAGVVMAINGSYYAKDGQPDTPVRSGGVRLGPAE